MPLKNELKMRYLDLNEEIDLKIFGLAIVVGILGGLASWVFNTLIDGIYYIFILWPLELLQGAGLHHLSWLVFLVSPIFGGVVVVFIVVKVSHEVQGHGIPGLIQSYHFEDAKLRGRVPILKTIGSAITISTGGSAGREGPIAMVGAGIGSVLAQKLDLPVKDRKILLLGGLAAGISATFNAPVGAALFCIEILRPRVNLKRFPIIIISSVTGFIVRVSVIGTDLVLDTIAPLVFEDLSTLPFFLVLGIACGILSGLWIKGFYYIEGLIKKLFPRKKIPALSQALVGRTLVGISLIILFVMLGPAWENYNLIGSTLKPIRYVISGRAMEGEAMRVILVLSVVLILKIVATPLTLAAGGSGGVFAPTLLIGALFGGLFAQICQMWFGITDLDMALLAIMGMAGFFAGTCRAPITSIVMTSEMSGNYSMIIPLMLVTSIGYILSFFIEKEDIYTMELKHRGIKLKFVSMEQLLDAPIEKYMISPLYIRKFNLDDKLNRIKDKIFIQSITTGFPVYDGKQFVNLVSKTDFLEYDSFNEIGKDTTIRDLLEFKKRPQLIVISADASLYKAYEIFIKHRISNLPVVITDEEGNLQLKGWIYRETILDVLEENIPEVDYKGQKKLMEKVKEIPVQNGKAVGREAKNSPAFRSSIRDDEPED